ncbi:MAG TPA: hypothetical protein VFD43_00260 [Planctomycetota bacterium]|nr:hypothetical protein [Planctomycetota bacterium]
MNLDFKYGLGSRVVMVEAKIAGWVDRVAYGLEFGHEYRVIFWHDGQRRAEWVYERELQRDDRDQLAG